jgi:hypothetical protein
VVCLLILFDCLIAVVAFLFNTTKVILHLYGSSCHYRWQGCKCDQCLALMTISREVPFTCHTCCDTGNPEYCHLCLTVGVEPMT